MRAAQTVSEPQVPERRARPGPAPVRDRPSLTSALELDHEQLVVRRGQRSGTEVIVAIHSTVLGPALGGVRMWPYDSPLEAIGDALRLAGGMTDKAAAAGLEIGGGKGVIRVPPGNGPPRGELRERMLLDFGDLVESLDGRYITAEDVGIEPQDMVTVRGRTSYVTGMPPARGGSGDPAPFTAMGVEAAIRACVAHRRGTAELRGLGIVVVGLGHVGSRLAKRLAAAGARLTVADIDPAKRSLAKRLNAAWVDPETALAADCDVLAPCALGGVIDRRRVARLGAEIVCGAANNQLAEESLASELAAREILYAPDFIANVGGLINVYRELRGLDEDWTREMAIGIESTMARILAISDARAITPLAAARELACERLEAALRD